MQSNRISDGLASLARSNQQNRDAALLRATTELFVRDSRHDRDQIRRYEELATHLLPKVATGDRAFVAEQLADSTDTPKAVIRMLARDLIDVAAPIVSRSPVIDSLDLLAVIAATGVEHHRLVARRTDLSNQVKRALRLTGDADVLSLVNGSDPARSGDTGESLTAGPARITSMAPRRQPGTDSTTDRRNPLAFLQLDRAQRLRVLADFAIRPPARRYAGAADRLDRAFRSILGAAKIVGHARAGDADALTSAIADGLGLDIRFVSACLTDTSGEALAVLLKALRLDDVQAQQVFLLATPSGRDTTAFFPLADLYAGMEASVAEAVCDQWRGRPEGRDAEHQTYLAEDRQPRRSTAAEARPRQPQATRERSRRA